jgi:LIVCS family branched-chain amino acid:cation transporter
MLVYPAIIVLLVGSLFDFSKYKPALQGAIITAVILSIGDFLGGMGMADNPFSAMTAKLPLGGQGLGWLVPALVVGALAMLLPGRSKK